MSSQVSLYEAKTHLSSLIERVASGEEVVITKNGVPKARIVPLGPTEGLREPAGVLKIHHLSPDFDASDPDVEALFDGG